MNGSLSEHTMKKSTAYSAAALILLLSLLVSFRPLGLWKQDFSFGISSDAEVTGSVYVGDRVYDAGEYFIAKYPHLRSIDFYVPSWDERYHFSFRLYDLTDTAAPELVYIQDISAPGNTENVHLGGEWRFAVPGLLPDQGEKVPYVSPYTSPEPENFYRTKTPMWVRVFPDADVKPGTQYIAMIQCPEATFELGLADARPEEEGFILGFVKDEGIPGKHLAMRVNYRVTAGPGRMARVLGFYCLLAAALLIPVLYRFKKHPERNTCVTAGRFLQVFLTPVIALPAAAGMVMVYPMQLFDHRATDNGLFLVGIASAAGFLLYGLWHRQGTEGQTDGRGALSRAAVSVTVAFLVGSGCEYMNAFYEAQHRAAEKKVAVSFAALIAVLVIPAVSAAARRRREAAEPSGGGESAAPASGAGQAARRIFAASGILFLLMTVIFRNGRLWPVALLGMAAALYAALRVYPYRERFLTAVGDGIFLNFTGMVVYCLLHRFYMLFLYTRYSMAFHTVTITAEYLSVVAAVAFTRFFQRKNWVNAGFAGTVGVYLLLTMSRTGLAAVALLLICIAFAVTAAGPGRFGERVRSSAASLLLVAAVTAAAFPAVFSLQRIVPVLVGEPHLFETEWYEDEVLHGENWNSRYFIRIERFYSLFLNRVFGLPEKQFDYGFNVSMGNSCQGEDDLLRLGLNEGISGTEAFARAPVFPGVLAAYAAEPGILAEEEGDYSNGRTAIWRSYLKELNLTGHEKMGVLLENGEEAVHAHNTFIQAFYDFGIPTGAVFLGFMALAMGAALIYYSKDSQDSIDALIPLASAAVFAASGLVEWVFHTCNPVTLFALLCLVPLVPAGRGKGEPETGQEGRCTDGL